MSKLEVSALFFLSLPMTFVFISETGLVFSNGTKTVFLRIHFKKLLALVLELIPYWPRFPPPKLNPASKIASPSS